MKQPKTQGFLPFLKDEEPGRAPRSRQETPAPGHRFTKNAPWPTTLDHNANGTIDLADFGPPPAHAVTPPLQPAEYNVNYNYNVLIASSYDDDWHDWHWWDGGYGHGWHHGYDRWSGWSFSFGYYSSSWFVDFSFGRSWGYRHHRHHRHHNYVRYVFWPYHHPGHSYHDVYAPWEYYALDYNSCWVTYQRPWRYRTITTATYYNDWWDDDAYVETRYIDPGYASYDLPPASPPLPTLVEAWSWLGAGDDDAAAAAFGDRLAVDPIDDDARLGYAVATAARGQHDLAIALLRQTLRNDVTTLDRVPRRDSLDIRFAELIEVYAFHVRNDRADFDALLFIAALRSLRDEHADAYFAVESAMRHGDGGDAALSLQRSLEAILYESF